MILKVCLIRNNCSGKVLFVSVIGEAPASPDALLHSSYLLKGYRPGRGIDMPAPGNARGERMQQGYAPEGGKRITAHHCKVAKGVNGIIILLPILGDVGCEQFPRRCLGLTCFWPFFLHFVLKASKLERRPCYPFVQADMLSACIEYEDILSDKQRGTHPSPPKGREPERGSVFSHN